MKTFIRRLAILDYLRTSKISKSTDQILHYLTSSDYFDGVDQSISGEVVAPSESSIRRTIQRDLNFLYGAHDVLNEESYNEFGLEVSRGVGKSLMWRLDPYSMLSYDFEKMPAYLALSFAMTQKHLSGIMPKTTLHELERFFKHADSKLQNEATKISPQQFGRLKDSVEFYQRGQRLQSAEYDINTLDTVYRAILKGKQLAITYRGKEYQVHPFGVVILLPKLYLVAKKNQDISSVEEYRHFLIHKIDHIEILGVSSQVPDTFSLKKYLDEGRMDVYVDPSDTRVYKLVVELNVLTASNLIADLTENPIANDQGLIKLDEGKYQLTASVKRTVQLKNWIMGLGSVATILSPEVIRSDLLSELTALMSNYENNY